LDVWEHIIIADGSTCMTPSKKNPASRVSPSVVSRGRPAYPLCPNVTDGTPSDPAKEKSEHRIGTVPQQILIQQPPKVVTQTNQPTYPLLSPYVGQKPYCEVLVAHIPRVHSTLQCCGCPLASFMSIAAPACQSDCVTVMLPRQRASAARSALASRPRHNTRYACSKHASGPFSNRCIASGLA
jgi:hypothetical protein